jgi:glycosyltransferase involved in cell wall biosynthesis
MNVSIVIPVYNEADYLESCLKAVAKQTVEPYEVLVIDNNSTDRTVQIAKKFGFVTVIPEPTQGIVFARNTGFRHAKGEILARIDADTILPANWVTLISKALSDDSNLSAVTGRPSFRDVPIAPLFNWLQVLLYQNMQKLLTGSYMLWGANMAVRKDAWIAVASNCSQRTDVDEDIDLSLCLHRGKFIISYLPELLVNVSLQRGKWTFSHTIKYLSTWPRDYRLHGMKVRAAFVGAISFLLVVGSLPVLIYQSLKSRGRLIYSRRGR